MSWAGSVMLSAGLVLSKVTCSWGAELLAVPFMTASVAVMAMVFAPRTRVTGSEKLVPPVMVADCAVPLLTVIITVPGSLMVPLTVAVPLAVMLALVGAVMAITAAAVSRTMVLVLVVLLPALSV